MDCEERSPAQSHHSTLGGRVQLAVPLKRPLWVAWKNKRLQDGRWLLLLVPMSRVVAGLSQTPTLTPRAAWALVEAMKDIIHSLDQKHSAVQRIARINKKKILHLPPPRNVPPAVAGLSCAPSDSCLVVGGVDRGLPAVGAHVGRSAPPLANTQPAPLQEILL